MPVHTFVGIEIDLLAAADELQRLRRGQDIDVLIVLQAEQVVIAGDDAVGLSGTGQGQHGIIVRIAAEGAWQRRRIDHLEMNGAGA